jgi:hypothetical protein
MMTMSEIFDQFSKGSPGFIKAVQTYHSGYECSDDEIARIASRAADAAEFDTIWENEDWWADDKN